MTKYYPGEFSKIRGDVNMIVEKRNILTVTRGVIVHQVNCQNRIGRGISGEIIKKYPLVETAYHAICELKTPAELLGTWQGVNVTGSLTIVNCFTQLDYGNPARTGRIYTDVKKLAAALADICCTYKDNEIWIPEKIGCGLGGADWSQVSAMLEPLPLHVASIT